MASAAVFFLTTDTTDLRQRELLLYDKWTEGLFVKDCLDKGTTTMEKPFAVVVLRH